MFVSSFEGSSISDGCTRGGAAVTKVLIWVRSEM